MRELTYILTAWLCYVFSPVGCCLYLFAKLVIYTLFSYIMLILTGLKTVFLRQNCLKICREKFILILSQSVKMTKIFNLKYAQITIIKGKISDKRCRFDRVGWLLLLDSVCLRDLCAFYNCS